jgi:hypothetical protein
MTLPKCSRDSCPATLHEQRRAGGHATCSHLCDALERAFTRLRFRIERTIDPVKLEHLKGRWLALTDVADALDNYREYCHDSRQEATEMWVRVPAHPVEASASNVEEDDLDVAV